VRCPVCATAVEHDEVVCPRCQTPHHRECWEYTGGCAIFGCDGLRWRPSRAPAALTAEAALLQARAESYLDMFRYHWVTFVTAGTGLVSAMTLYAVIPLFFLFFPPVTDALQGAAWAASMAELFLYAVTLGATAVYFSLAIPAYLRARALEASMGSALPRPGDNPDAVAERLELPAFGRATLAGFRVAAAVLTALLGVVVVAASFAAILYHGPAPYNLVRSPLIILFLRLALLPWFEAATRSRMEILVSMQNRMIASFKDGGAKD